MSETPATGRYHHGDLRRALLSEARVMLESDGIPGLSLRKLAQRVGVSRGAPYHHFKSKEALLAAIIEDGFRQVHARTLEAVDGVSDPWHALRQSGRVYVSFALQHPALYRMMMGHMVPEKRAYESLKDASGTYYEGLRARIGACIGTGQTRHADVELAAFTVWCGVHGLASLLLDGGLEHTPSRVEQTIEGGLVDNVLTGLVHGLRTGVDQPSIGVDGL